MAYLMSHTLLPPGENVFILKNKGRETLIKHEDALPSGLIDRSIFPLE